MIPRKFDRILDDCLLRMDRGESLMDILAVYPAQADKLKPLILVAMLSRALPQPVPGYTALRVGKNQLLAEMASMQAEDSFIKPKPVQPPRERVVDRWVGSLKRLQPAYRFAMLSLVVILAGGFFTLSASASGLADNIIHTLFYSFEQVGDLLLVKPNPPKIIKDNTIFSSDYDLPDLPGDYSGDYKTFVLGENNKDLKDAELPGDKVLDQRVYDLSAQSEESDLDDDLDEDKDDDKDLDGDGIEDKDQDEDIDDDKDDDIDEDKDDDKDLDGDGIEDKDQDEDQDDDLNEDKDDVVVKVKKDKKDKKVK